MKFNPDHAPLYKHMFNAICEFRRVFDLPIATQMTDAEDANHNALLVEELTELAVAKSKVAQADAVVDALYVHMGRLVQMNIYDPMHNPVAAYPIQVLIEVGQRLELSVLEIFDEVHQSNMSKVVTNEEDLNASIDVLTSKGYEVKSSEVEYKNKKYFILKAATDSAELGVKAGKVLKPVTFHEPDIKKLLN